MNIDDWLAELKVPREAYRVVMLLPLIYVAWADGKVQGPERAVILRIAREKGLLDNGGADALERWLSEAPSKAQLKADLKVLNELGRSRESIAKDFGADDEQLLLAWCQDVADAAGGLLGLRSARHDAERAALKTIAATLDVGGAKNWRAKLGDQ
jgi:tellurite resistance protein